MTYAHVIFNRTHGNETEPRGTHFGSQTLIDHLLSKLSMLDLPAKEHFENYLRYKVRSNLKPT